MQGRDIIMEDLREYCLFNILKEQDKSLDWWKYMKEVHSYCYDYVTIDCSKQGMKEIGANFTQVEECVSNTFTSPNNFGKGENTVLATF